MGTAEKFPSKTKYCRRDEKVVDFYVGIFEREKKYAKIFNLHQDNLTSS